MKFNNRYSNGEVINGIRNDIDKIIKRCTLVRCGFVEYQHDVDNTHEDMCHPVSRECCLKDFGFTYIGGHEYEMENPFLYNRAVESVAEEFIYDMALMVAQLAAETACSYDEKILHRLTYDKLSNHVVLYPVDDKFDNSQKSTGEIVEKLMRKNSHNVNLQPFIADDYGDLDNIFCLTSNSNLFGSLCYHTKKIGFDDQTQTMTLSMRLLYKGKYAIHHSCIKEESL